MKIFFLALLLSLPGGMGFAQSPVEGDWKTIDPSTGKPRSVVHLSVTPDQQLEGVIVKVFPSPGDPDRLVCDQCQGERKNQPVIGMKFMWGLRADGDEFNGGQILDPKNGKIYKCFVNVEEGGKALRVRGYLGFALLGRTQIWERVASEPQPTASPADKENAYFRGHRGCFLLADLRTGKIEKRIGGEFCVERVFACSTFKIPLSLMAFDKGLLLNEDSGFKWDGTKYNIEPWNRDQTAKTWIANSVVWFSQKLTPLLGMNAVKRYLADFRYGNEDMSGGLTKAWLSSSLKLSAEEQVTFWKRFWTEQLGVSKHAFEMTKKISFIEASKDEAVLYGKTGSGSTSDYRIGWFAGYVKRGDKEYVFALNFQDTNKPLSKAFAGGEAREMAKAVLSELGIF